jgi:hypothetical protein
LVNFAGSAARRLVKGSAIYRPRRLIWGSIWEATGAKQAEIRCNSPQLGESVIS